MSQPARPSQQTPRHLLRAYLRTDAPSREKVAMKVMAWVCLGTVPLALAMVPVQGWRLSVAISMCLAAVALYSLVLLEWLSRGHYHRFIPALNVLIEVSTPLPPLVLFYWSRGLENAQTSPVYTAWGALVVFSALRSRPWLCVMAGVVAALESGVLYFAMGVPHGPHLETMDWPWAMQRSFYLLLSGGAGAALARSLVHKAEQALRAVRAQDLMGKYFLHERLGAGGMAEVFRATYCPEGGFEKAVAIKRILPALANRPHFNKLFLQEARLCARLNHPNIVQVFDCGRFQDTFILAMEYVDGMTLYRLLASRTRGLPIAAVSYLAGELASALDYVHHRIGEDGQPLNLVHRDINPPNVLLSRFGEVKLGDFGVAHAAHVVEGKGFVGKTSYASPEQRRGEKVTPQSDLYALGLTIYEALTANPVFGSEEQTDPSIRVPTLVPPSKWRSDVPRALDEAVMWLLAPDPADRPRRGNEVREVLLALRGAAAPFPDGPTVLAREVDAALSSQPAPLPENRTVRLTDEHPTVTATGRN
jgi:hypothetical protein